MPGSTTPFTDEEIQTLREFYIDKSSTRLDADLTPRITIPRLLATLEECWDRNSDLRGELMDQAEYDAR